VVPDALSRLHEEEIKTKEKRIAADLKLKEGKWKKHV
jgi:hypothetical protein